MLESMEADRAFIAENDARILELEAEIYALRCSIALLEHAKKPAQERLDSYKYPISTLPPEIVAEVFLHFLPTYPEPPPLVGPDSPTILAEICRQWREIALSLPALWSAIPLTSTVKTVTSLAPVWLERSGCLPVSITATDDDELFPVFCNLIPHCDRWEHLKLSLENTDNIDALNVPMPLLSSLDIYLGNQCLSESTPLDLQRRLPSLRSVILDDYGRPSFILPWSQLTSLTLRYMYPRQCMLILQQTLHLEHLVLSFLEPGYRPDEFPDTVLKRLESLHFEKRSHLNAVFSTKLVTPALLRLHFAILVDSDPIEPLKAFIAKSGCLLHELRVSEDSVSEDACREAFPLIPNIILC
ncbi:F-box domain-containing protein [Favolaschia claudopus]|uniref:F-box domain-containing protein n=1 Tax=Favolaschia claudopus TaxID=2862362 RepID=A0AAW0AJ88_9AGAR